MLEAAEQVPKLKKLRDAESRVAAVQAIGEVSKELVRGESQYGSHGQISRYCHTYRYYQSLSEQVIS